MMEKTRHRVCHEAVDVYGTEAQMVVAVEEFSELQKEICKKLRGAGSRVNMAEEIADVEIMLEQIKYMLAGDDEYERIKIDMEIEAWKESKVRRLAGMIQEYKRVAGDGR